ncbi:hypothetical protein [Kitasatospora sp. NPDC050543]
MSAAPHEVLTPNFRPTAFGLTQEVTRTDLHHGTVGTGPAP